MIPELGQFSLILALLLAALLGTLPLVGAQRRIGAWMALARPLAAGQFVFIAFAFACLAMSFVAQRLLGAQCRDQFELAAPAAIPDRRDVGLARGLDAAVGADARRVDGRRRAEEPSSARRDGRARIGRHGIDRVRLPALHAADVESVRAAVSARRRRPRSESAAAGSGDGVPSAAPVHGLRRLLGRVRVRDRRVDRRPARRDVGALVAAVDNARVVVSHLRDHARQRVGVLRARLGRLVVLGPGRERVVHAVARRHRAHSFARGHREARDVQGVDRAARDLRVLAVAARNVPRALRCAHLGPRVRDRSAPRRVHPRVPRARDRRLARRFSRCARRRSAAAAASTRFRARRCCSRTTCC